MGWSYRKFDDENGLFLTIVRIFSMPKDTLYYDGQCPLCNSEMQKLRQLANKELQLVDIHGLGDGEDLPSKQALLGNLHLKKSNGELLTGLDANVAAWQHTRFGLLFRWLRWPLVGAIADRVYGYWAGVRYRRLYADKSPDK